MENRTRGEKAAEELVLLIREKRYQSGDKLPTEYELSSLLGVSRNTIREALRILVSRNIVVIRQGAGTFVADAENRGVTEDPLGFLFIEDRKQLAKDLLQVRYILEPQIAALAAEHATEEDIARLEDILQRLEACMLLDQDFKEIDREFHIQIARCSQNMVMSALLPVISSGVTVFSETVSTQEYEQTIKSHRRILEAIGNRRPTEAMQAMQFHLLYNQNRFQDE